MNFGLVEWLVPGNETGLRRPAAFNATGLRSLSREQGRVRFAAVPATPTVPGVTGARPSNIPRNPSIIFQPNCELHSFLQAKKIDYVWSLTF
jgi:hypothetical protein